MEKLKRTSGVLLHLTSLPGSYGIGEIGPQAFKFVDDLAEMNQKLWQILPDNPTDSYNCPYGAISAFANNPLLISLDFLIRDGWLISEDLKNYPKSESNNISFKIIKSKRSSLLLKSADKFLKNKTNSQSYDFNNFCKKNKYWLEKFALFKVLQKELKEEQWIKWPRGYKLLKKKYINPFIINHKYKIKSIKVLQYLYFKQWEDLKSYANSKGIQIIGDIPIYVSMNSVDVWANQNLFKLNQNGEMRMQSGCPPDYFMKTGQVWGHPIYDWLQHKKTNYDWWVNRISFLFKKVDIIRIDHFNGFARYWEVPAKDSSGINGQWIVGPGKELFDSIKESISNKIILAEDLGEAYEDAKKIREPLGIPGMKILQFSFGNGKPLEDIEKNTVVYTGTHDNNTSIGWYYDEPGKDSTESLKDFKNLRKEVKKYIDFDKSNLHWSMVKYAMESKASFCIIPLQDILGLGSLARMNTPGTIGNNWQWRYSSNDLNKKIKTKFRNITKESNR